MKVIVRLGHGSDMEADYDQRDTTKSIWNELSTLCQHYLIEKRYVNYKYKLNPEFSSQDDSYTLKKLFTFCGILLFSVNI